MASPARFERAAFRLGGGCSIRLSYGDNYTLLFYTPGEKKSMPGFRHLFACPRAANVSLLSVHTARRFASQTRSSVVLKKGVCRMPQPTKAIISNEQKSGIRKGSNRASTGKVGALLLSVYI